jgi:shikimate kinase
MRSLGQKVKLAFHQCLTKMLTYHTNLDNIVVATDETIVCYEAARKILQSQFTVYITVSTPTQIARMGNYRPLLPVDDYAALLDSLHQKRDAWYANAASFTLSSDDGDIDSHAKSILNICSISQEANDDGYQ